MITLTEAAYNKIKKLIESKHYAGIRVGVKTTGCSGLAYVMEYVNQYVPDIGITNFAQPDFALLIDDRSLPYLEGMTIDYVREGLNEGFRFINPNERDRCGCGESFRV
jgi:iron-sulfur cluster assembly protein